jgi:hypothetical protein
LKKSPATCTMGLWILVWRLSRSRPWHESFIPAPDTEGSEHRGEDDRQPGAHC